MLAALAVGVALVVFPALAGADPSTTPTVTTDPATSVMDVSATLNGSVNPNDSDTTATYNYTFSWGTSSGVYTSSGGSSISGGTSDQPVSLPVSGLSANTQYFFQLCASNSADSTDPGCGSEQSFTTDGPPTVTAGSASSLGQTSATLNGTIDPNDPDEGGSYTFSWGTSPGVYTTGSGGGSYSAGTSAGPVSLSIGSLNPDTTYYFQLCATGTYGTNCDTGQFVTVSPPPTVTTTAATSVTPTTATLNGSINPNGSSTSYTFEWGTAPGGPYPNTSGGSAGSGTSVVPESAAITGLSPTTPYYYKLCATNGTGSACGVQQTFTTPNAPTVTTGANSQITPTTATLKGMVNPNGADTSYTFEWGPTSGGPYPNTSGGSAGSGTSAVQETAQITGLSPHTTYFYVLCASNAFGSPCGVQKSFFAPDQPTSVTGGASGVTTSAATLAGTVNPNGANVTSVYFNYGTTTTYTSTTNATPLPGSGMSAVSVSASLSGLATGTTFHYQLCATNTWGTGCGADQTFATNTPPTASLKASPTSGPTPLAVTFDGSGSSDSDGSIASWTLTFGDSTSTSGTGPVPSSIPHIYTSACSCTASLKVTDNQGAQSAASTVAINVTLNQPPVASLVATPSPATGTVPLAVSFDGSGSFDPDSIPLKSWSLDFGDKTTRASGGPGPVPNAIPHTYTTPGIYTAILTVTDSSNATATKSVTVTVNPQPTISVRNDSVDYGTTNAVFPLTLSAPSTHDVTVQYATADGTAKAPADYTAGQGTLTIPAGTSCPVSPVNPACTITVQVSGAPPYKSNFTLTLSNPGGATIATGVGTATLNVDTPPVLMIENNAILEGNAGSIVSGAQSWLAGGSLTLNDASGFSLGSNSFSVSTPGLAAVSTYTFQGMSGNTLTGIHPAGSVSVGQIAFQPRTITLTVLLCDPNKMPPGDSDPGDCDSAKGAETASGLDTTVQYATSDGSTGQPDYIPVREGQDYVYSTGTLTIKAGQKTGQLTFQTIPNTTQENPKDPTTDLTRWFNVNLSNSTNASIAWGLGTAQILEDDGPNPPTATTGAPSAIGTNSATVSATVNPNALATGVYVQYGTSISYGSQTASQSFPAGDTSDEPLSFDLTGLSPGTKYHYQVVAQHGVLDGGGVGYGADMTFTTDVAPTAALGANPTSGDAPLKVTFDGSGSSDPDGSIASWTLDFGDGSTPASGSGPVPSAITHTYTSSCSCTASLTVTDNQGAQSTPATVAITANGKDGQPPPSSPAGVPSPLLLTMGSAATGPTTAKVQVEVDPNGAQTQLWVEYGKGPPYDSTSPAQRISADGTRTLTFALTELAARTLYHYRVVAVHTTDAGSANSQYETFTTLKATPMSISVKSRVTATANGVVPLPFSCTGTSLTRCKGQAILELGNLAAGFKSFSVLPKHRTLVRIKLKSTVLKSLFASTGGLHLKLTISLQSGIGITGLTTKRITVLPPAAHK